MSCQADRPRSQSVGWKRKVEWVKSPVQRASTGQAKRRHLETSPDAAPAQDCARECPRESQCTWPHHQIPVQSSEEFHRRFLLTGRVLGSGQFGSVRECADRRTGERFACKTLKTPDCATSDSLATWELTSVEREASAMARLRGHPGIVQVQGLYRGEGEARLVMDLCEGGDLCDEVIRRQRFAEADAREVFQQLVAAVAACHAQGILHRDLKPENILLSTDCQTGRLHARLADFGLAVSMAAGEKLQGMAGSPFYMAPEVVQGQYDVSADVWSLGVVLHILLVGHPPFWGACDRDTFAAILGHSSLDIDAPALDHVSVEAKGLLQMLLRKDPLRRPRAETVLAHPWVQPAHSDNRDSVPKIPQRQQIVVTC